ncbi:MAG: malate dehydrogenase [Candidatus Omnitrophica bacterium]|nr:malate dehydrogenase [Candidatus Omnitrophota bacterium]
MAKGKKNGKISVIGAGNVGAMLTQLILERNLANVTLLDIDEGMAKGKACDIQDAASILGYDKVVKGTSDYSEIADSDVIVITAGFPRKPGMSREDLLNKNRVVVREISLKIKEFSPDSIVIVVTNPLDLMSYLAYKTTGFDKRKVIGMAGVLDSARCSNQASEELGITQTEVDSLVIGTHDTNMIPLFAHSKAQGKSFKAVFDQSRQSKIAERTRNRGAEIVSYLKSGSAFFAPSAACFSMVKSILNNENLTLCASAYLEGEYGLNDMFIGVPIVLGQDGIEKIMELELSDDEVNKLKNAAEQMQNAISRLGI